MSNPEIYSVEDYANDMPPRAFGSETEFTTADNVEEKLGYFTKGGIGVKLLDYVDPRYFSSTGRDDYHSVIMTTGGEVYCDGPLEYATPECRTPAELAIHTRAGEQIVTDISRRLALDSNLRPELYKRAGYAEVTRNGEVLIKAESIGHHENYTSENEFSLLPPLALAMRLGKHENGQNFADFLALRKLIDGVGMVTKEGFSISQKPSAISYRQFTSLTGHGVKRPFFQKPGRIEVRSGEGGKSQWAEEFRVGLTSLVLRLIEHNAYPHHLALSSPRIAVLNISRDPFAAVELKNGHFIKGIDVLKLIVDYAMDLHQKFPDAPRYEAKAGRDFYKFYDDLHETNLREGNVSALSDRIDWAARYEYFLERGATYDTITADDLSQVRDDLKWDELGPRDIARRRFSKFGHTALFVPMQSPPNTRAKERTKIAKKLYENDDLISVKWDSIQPYNGKYYVFPDVFSDKTIRLNEPDTLFDEDDEEMNGFY